MSKILLNLLLLVCVFISCKKEKREDPHNHSLLNKTIDQIRTELAGRWQLKRTHAEVCGVAGCVTYDTTFANNSGDYFYFLPNDTVKQTGVSGYPIKVWDKAQIQQQQVTSPRQGLLTVYLFNGGNAQWEISAVKNDTLVIGSFIYLHYLTR